MLCQTLIRTDTPQDDIDRVEKKYSAPIHRIVEQLLKLKIESQPHIQPLKDGVFEEEVL